MSEQQQEGGKPNSQPQDDGSKQRKDDTLNKFAEIKERYEQELSDKDKEIADLKQQLSEKNNEIDETIDDLNNEVNEKLKQAEKMKKLQEDVNELLADKANALVDKYISEGKLVPAQKEKALKLCLADQDMFIELYEDAPSIVDTTQKPRSRTPGNVDKMVKYFKN